MIIMKTLLAVDGNSILNRAFYGIRPLTNSKGLYTHAVYGFVNILLRQLEDNSPDAFAVAFDLKGPTFRHKQYDGYKATRKGMPDELAVQLPYAKRAADALGARVMTLEGFEADDILGSLSRLCEADNDEWRVLILTGDRDSLQLISAKTNILLATNAQTIKFDAERFKEEYGVLPTQFVDVKALMGDSSDNIPGVPGIGEKTALKLIGEFGTLDGVYENLASATIARGVRSKLESGRDSAYMSRSLATIDTNAPLGVAASDLVTPGFNRCELLELFVELEFTGLIRKLGLDNSETEQRPTQGDDCKNEQITLDDLSSGFSCPLALTINEGKIQLSRDGETIYELSDVDVGKAVSELGRRGAELIVYDSKKYYNDYDSIPDDYLFSYDVMLAEYVIDPSEGSYAPERIKLKYLGATGDSLNAAELYRLWQSTLGLIRERGQEKLLFCVEQPLAKVLSRMEKVGFKVDINGLMSFSSKLGDAADEVRERIYFEAGTEFNINSPKQLGEVLFERLGLPSGKKTKSGYSTSAEVLERLAPYSPIVTDILEYRQLTKLKSTYGDGLVKAADRDGLIHTSFNQTITATGRLSSTEPNLQNIPVRTELGRELRRFFIPHDEGRVLIDADYSQIELRLLAHISGDETMIEAFKNGIDIHKVTASQAFGVPIEAVTPEMRKRAKAVNFGIVYGISDFSLAQDIGVTKKQAGEYIDAYLAKYPKVAEYLKDIVARAYEDGYVTTLLGRRRYIPELSSGKKMLKAFGERVAMNSPIQGTAADIIKLAMINVDRALRDSKLDAKLILQVHDELIVDASRADAEAAKEILQREMESAVKLSLPLTVSTAVGENWYECKE